MLRLFGYDPDKVDVDKVGGFDKDGIIYNDIFSIMKLADKIKARKWQTQ